MLIPVILAFLLFVFSFIKSGSGDPKSIYDEIEEHDAESTYNAPIMHDPTL